MKISSLFLAASLFFVCQKGIAQEARAGAILDAMSKKMKAMTSFGATFTYATDGSKDIQKGEVTVKGAKFRLKLVGQEMYNDGKTLATYVKETNEVNLSNYEPTEGDFNPTKIYSIYKKGYKYSFIEELKESGQVYEVVELTPENKSAKIAKLRMNIHKTDRTIKSWRVTDKAGKKQTFKIEKFTPNVPAQDDFFVFDKKKFPGVEVIDLRD